MKQWLVLFRKELLESWRMSRWLWVPLVFAMLGALQPLTSHFMPQILEVAGGLPEGAVIEIPPPTPGAAIASSLNQLGTLGLLILALVGMGAVAGERIAGTAAMVLVKPVSRLAYVLAKWASYNLLMLAALVLGQAAAWYYTDLLIGPVPASDLVASTSIFALWLSLVLTILLAFGTVLRSPGAVAAATIGVVIALAALAALPGEAMAWNPARLAGLAAMRLTTGASDGLLLPVITAVAAIVALVGAASVALRLRPMIA